MYLIKNLLIISLSLISGFLIFEFFLFVIKFGDNFSNYKYSAMLSNQEFDSRTRFEYYNDLLKEDDDAVLLVTPSYYLDNEKIFPLSGIENKTTVLDNENGFYVDYISDENGFRNPQSKLQKHYDAIIVGDSYANGCCVKYEDSFAGLLLNNTKFKNVLTLASDGNGSLIEYASIKEYLPEITFDNLFWFYYEQNDIGDLTKEKQNSILLNYLEDDKFKQNLILKKEEVLKVKLEKHQDIIKAYKYDEKLINFYQFKNILKLRRTRNMINSIMFNFKDFVPSKSSKQNQVMFEEIIKKTYKFTRQKNADFYFIYIPEYNTVTYPKQVPQEHYNKNEVINFLEEAKINFLDLTDSIRNYKDTKSLYPYRKYGHFNEKGNKFIIKKISDKFILH